MQRTVSTAGKMNRRLQPQPEQQMVVGGTQVIAVEGVATG